ncbi:hypothetical protein IGI04_037077 [Brassica rapa subsp. trilocularis]|uniref:Uncharacterized protein n=1 Tax=Brassica rapa subsp. trilocularis TaxID=1813537 RepID=A0ABQ7LGA2_BRACM|nr:hypothetical protein IGI04_037077 [Brassica rapa subsp. trilocularis]
MEFHDGSAELCKPPLSVTKSRRRRNGLNLLFSKARVALVKLRKPPPPPPPPPRIRTGDDGSRVASISRIIPTEHASRSIFTESLQTTVPLLQSRATYDGESRHQSSDKAIVDGTVKTKRRGPETMKKKVLRRRHRHLRADRTPE